MSDINIQTSAQTTLAWRRNGVDGDPWKSFGSDPSISDVSVDLDVDEQSDYGTRDVVNRELTGVSGSLGVDVTANHWWLTEHWLEEFADTPTDNGDGTFTWTGDGTEDYVYIDVRIGNTRSGEDYIFERCASDADVSMSSPYGGGDNNVELSFTIDVSYVRKEEPTTQDTEPEILFQNADPLYFKNSRVSTPDSVDETYVLTELSFSVTNNDEGISQIPVVYYVSDITALSAPVTPSASSVGVQTDTVDNATVRLYDGSDVLLGEADASSSEWIAVDVGGTDVASVQLVRGGDITNETISVNTATDGSGTTETADVSTSTTSQGGLEDVTRSPGDRELEVSRTVLRNNNDEEFERVLNTNGEPDGAQDPEYDLSVTIGNSIVDGSEVTGVSDIHEITFTFSDLFPTEFSWSGFDERGGDISQELSDGAAGLTAEYRVGTDTRP